MNSADHRRRLPDRRECERFAFEHPPHSRVVYSVCFGRYPDGRLAEIFLTTNKASSAIDAAARDAALLCSLLLQYGCPPKTIRDALSRDNDGAPAAALGVALAKVEALPLIPARFVAAQEAGDVLPG